MPKPPKPMQGRAAPSAAGPPCFSEDHRSAALIHALALAAIAVITAAAFAPVLSNGFVNWGDQAELVNNDHYKGFALHNLQWMFTTIHMGHYQPLTWLTFALDYQIWELNSRAFHGTSLLLHIACAMATYFLLLKLLGVAGWRQTCAGDGVVMSLAAAAGALLFSLHPLRVETVAWASERRGALSGLFYVLSILCYLRYAASLPPRAPIALPASRQSKKHSSPPVSKPALRNYVLAIVCLALSLLAKEFSISLPIILLILDVYPLRRLGGGGGGGGGPGRWLGPQGRAVLLEKAPFLILAAIGALVATQSSVQSGVAKSMSDYTLTQRLAQAFWGLAFYPAKTIAPVDLSPLYPIPRHLNPLESRFIVSAAIVIAVTAILIAVRKRWPALLVCWTSYVVIVLPVLGLVQTGRQMAADRYTYLPAIGLSALVSWALARAWREGGAAARRSCAPQRRQQRFLRLSFWAWPLTSR